MSSGIASQVLCGPFSSADIPDKDASLLHIHNEWSRYLTVTERDILMAVWFRTTRFSKHHEALTTYEISVGQRPNPPGFAGSPGVQASKATFYRAMKTLLECGILVRSGNNIAIDYSVRAADISRHGRVQARIVKASKNDPFGPKDADEVAETVMLQSHIYETQKSHMSENLYSNTIDKRNNHAHTREVRLLAGFDSIEEALAAAAAKKTQVRAKRLIRYNITDYGKLFQDAWHTAMRERFPKLPAVPWSQSRELPHIKRSILMPAKSSDISPEELARFIVKNWLKIRAKYFGWMKQFPEKPEVMFVSRNAAKYFEAFSTGLTEGDDATITDSETTAAENKKLREQLSAKERKLKELEQLTVGVIKEQENTIKKLVRRRRVISRPVDTDAILDYDMRVTNGKIK